MKLSRLFAFLTYDQNTNANTYSNTNINCNNNLE